MDSSDFVLQTVLPVGYEPTKRALLHRLNRDPDFVVHNMESSAVTFTKEYDFPAPIKAITGISAVSAPQTLRFDDVRRVAGTYSSQTIAALGCPLEYTLELSYASRSPHATAIVATINVDLSSLGPVSSILRPLLLRYFQSKFDEERQIELEIAQKLTS